MILTNEPPPPLESKSPHRNGIEQGGFARWVFGAACLSFQPLLLNAFSIPVTAYILRSLGAVAYGQWAIAVSLISAVTILTNLGLRGVFIRNLASRPNSANEAIAEQMGLRLLLAVMASTVAFLACFALGYPAVVVQCCALAACGMIFTTVATTVADFLRAFQRLPMLASINLASGFLLTVASVIAVWLGAGPVGLSLAYVLGPLTGAFLSLRLVHRQGVPLRIGWNIHRFGELLRDSRHIAAQQCFAAVGNNAEMLMVPKLVGVTDFGIFASGTMLAERLMVIPDAIDSAIYPVIARSYHKGSDDTSQEVVRVVLLILLICVPIAVLFSMLAYPIAQILFPREAVACRMVIQITVWSLPLGAIDYIMNQALNAVGKDPSQARLSILMGVTNMLMAILLISFWGLPGACWSWLLRFPVRIAFRCRGFAQTFRLDLYRLPLGRILACNGVMAAVLGLFLVATANDVFLSGSGLWVGCLVRLATGTGLGGLIYTGSVLSLRVVDLAFLLTVVSKSVRKTTC